MVRLEIVYTHDVQFILKTLEIFKTWNNCEIRVSEVCFFFPCVFLSEDYFVS